MNAMKDNPNIQDTSDNISKGVTGNPLAKGIPEEGDDKMPQGDQEVIDNGDGTFSVKVPTGDNRPKTNAEARERFGPVLEKLLQRHEEARETRNEDVMREVRRSLRKLGYSLRANRGAGGYLTI